MFSLLPHPQWLLPLLPTQQVPKQQGGLWSLIIQPLLIQPLLPAGALRVHARSQVAGRCAQGVIRVLPGHGGDEAASEVLTGAVSSAAASYMWNRERMHELKSRHPLPLAGIGHRVQKAPFQRQLTFSCAICRLLLPDACLTHVVSRLAKRLHSTAEAHVCPSCLLPGWLRAQGMLRAGLQAVSPLDSCLLLPLCEALWKKGFLHMTAHGSRRHVEMSPPV